MNTPPAAKSDAPAAPKSDEGKSRYKGTLNLPQTPFAMKANLVQNEPMSVKRWQSLGVYGRLREARKSAPKWVFHDGPPYANGSLHLGHLMNKCLKDFVVRSRSMQGLDVAYVPGWDCHGLPIEHKVVSDMMEGGKGEKLRGLDGWTRATAVRRECQKHAEKYVKLQSGQLQRFLTLADYEKPYLTMSREYEAAVLEVLAGLMERGLVYRALKPVHWSVANETALAEAELEYMDREDISVYVDFEASDPDAVYAAFGLNELNAEADEDGDDQRGIGAEQNTEAGERQDHADDESSNRRAAPAPGTRPAQRPCFMIWTTTPWTLPANLAIAVNPKFEYALVWVDGNVTVMAAEAVERVTRAAKAEQVVVLARTSGAKLVGLGYRHPFVERDEMRQAGTPAPQARGRVFTVVDADYVTLEDGTGLVHTAPGHGTEDYQTGVRVGLPIYCPVKVDGTYDASVPEWLRGQSIWDANPKVVRHLRDSGHLFYEHAFTHSYPHDWRSKTPVIFRCTEQWFVGVDAAFGMDGTTGSLRARSLEAIGGVAFVPDWGRNRMRGMLESRPDWCISRQRAWGLPIPAFVLPDGKAFMTVATVQAVIGVVRERGSDAWFTMPPEQLLAGYNPRADKDAPAEVREGRVAVSALKKGGDILDVWFESGSSWHAVLRQRPELGFPAELYLEGSDQHRGWFQASLLPSLGVTGRPPYRTLLTHGFMVDRDGKKLSKSRPDAHRYEVDSLCAEFGMDVMRWWVSSLAYENDVKVDVELFGLAGESYRKVRNTLRFMLSNLSDFRPGDGVMHAPTSLEAWVLGTFDQVVRMTVEAYKTYQFQAAHKALFDFCNETLSATYLAAVKDRLYCDKADSPRRRRTQAALWTITDGLCRLLAPIMCHTADEAWRALRKEPAESAACVHLETFPRESGVSPAAGWTGAMEALARAGVALERAKAALGVENPLDAGVVLPDREGTLAAFERTDLADLLGVSEVTLDTAAAEPRVVDLRGRERCERSWKRDGTVKRRSDGGMLSDRDAAAVGVG